jgi:hypothetical protein
MKRLGKRTVCQLRADDGFVSPVASWMARLADTAMATLCVLASEPVFFFWNFSFLDSFLCFSPREGAPGIKTKT